MQFRKPAKRGHELFEHHGIGLSRVDELPLDDLKRNRAHPFSSLHRSSGPSVINEYPPHARRDRPEEVTTIREFRGVLTAVQSQPGLVNKHRRGQVFDEILTSEGARGHRSDIRVHERPEFRHGIGISSRDRREKHRQASKQTVAIGTRRKTGH